MTAATQTGLKFYPKSHRYKLDGEWATGVTTAIGKGRAKPQLVDWAAREVARYAADHLDTLNALPDNDSVYDLLKQAHERKRDKAAVRGSEIHELAERLVHGDEIDVPEHIEGAVEGYARFLDAWQPTPVVTERPCASREWRYAGTPDAVLTLPSGERLLADWKTGARVYGDVALQLAAYRGAEFYADDDGTEHPMPEVDGLAVVHVTPTGTDLYRIADPDAAWRDWLHVLWVARADKRIRDQIGDPAQPPVLETT